MSAIQSGTCAKHMGLCREQRRSVQHAGIHAIAGTAEIYFRHSTLRKLTTSSNERNTVRYTYQAYGAVQGAAQECTAARNPLKCWHGGNIFQPKTCILISYVMHVFRYIYMYVSPYVSLLHQERVCTHKMHGHHLFSQISSPLMNKPT
jgi:hypothetical protein